MLTDKEKKKNSFLWLDESQFHSIESKKRGVNTCSIYKSIPKLLKAFRRIYIKLNFLPISFWLESWNKRLSEFDVVIIHASILTPVVVRFIAKKNPKIRIIVWYWNPVSKCVPVSSFPKRYCEIWTFDEVDAKKYQINYNTQYYFNDVDLEKESIEFDAFFVGSDKGRYADLIGVENLLKENNVKTYFHIVKSKKKLSKINYPVAKLAYEDVLLYISKSRAIVDVVSEKQAGLTLRPLESLFFLKKAYNYRSECC
ncbi:hypothetical protein HLB35_07650 [Halomonas sp. TBZ9]|uniref:Uncharacterized protein n=1 Tax=Vreelandella azerica TaxID=2732867 RepID=A0A7Y3XAT8_9GAMM|nr:hypothetical protein [Halomonas azerica]NOG31679.1 hypothetical protein [Halomonas azerica]